MQNLKRWAVRWSAVDEHLRYLVYIKGQVAACLFWASAAWKVKGRDQFIGWDEETKRKNLHLIANNTRFLIPEWVKIKHLASRVLALHLKGQNPIEVVLSLAKSALADNAFVQEFLKLAA